MLAAKCHMKRLQYPAQAAGFAQGQRRCCKACWAAPTKVIRRRSRECRCNRKALDHESANKIPLLAQAAPLGTQTVHSVYVPPPELSERKQTYMLNQWLERVELATRAPK